MVEGLDTFDGLLDWDRLQPWIDANDLPGEGRVTAVARLVGGTQNNVFRLERGRESFVLRRPPLHPRANSNETMRREARVLRALGGSDVPHPALYASCDDPAVIGASFYAMATLEGYSPWGQLPGRYATDPAWRRAMGDAFVGAAAALAAVDYRDVGLEDLGKAADWHARQVSRWRRQLEGYADSPNYPGHDLPYVDEVAEWLSARVPHDGRVGVIHGDLNLCNVMFSHDAPRITGIIDWELTTLGDPLLDLGWTLASWREADDPPGQEPLVEPWDGFVSRADLVRRYGELTGRDMTSMPWYFGLACFKLACILQGNFARGRAGLAPMEIGERHHRRAQWLLRVGRQVIDREG
jgi:aminoglycoside phosphotransferase (APT) family kinase protein